MDLPVRILFTQRMQPFLYTGLTRIDLLPAADETDNHSPILMPVHDTDEKLRLRLVKIWHALFSLHKFHQCIGIPCTLRLVKNGNFLDGRAQ